MLTNEDIIKLSEVLATKEDIKGLDERITKLELSMQSLTTAVDNLTSAVNKLTEEYKAIIHITDRHEKWIKKLAEKMGVNLDY
jgi:archaellum component FlaC